MRIPVLFRGGMFKNQEFNGFPDTTPFNECIVMSAWISFKWRDIASEIENENNLYF